jgi:predicted nuclease with RNAse H fold
LKLLKKFYSHCKTLPYFQSKKDEVYLLANVKAYMGIDVQVKRGCPFVVLDTDLKPVTFGWLRSPESISDIIREVTQNFGPVAVGIDAPRQALDSPRSHYWQRGKWRTRRPSDQGYGRHCEVVIAALKLANPQWTPFENVCPEWMQHGFRLFSALSAKEHVYEVFPTASYRQLEKESSPMFSVSLGGFAAGAKDMLDAYVAAYTVHQYLEGPGVAVGDGDGMGAIILPRKIKNYHADLLVWPTN